MGGCFLNNQTSDDNINALFKEFNVIKIDLQKLKWNCLYLNNI